MLEIIFVGRGGQGAKTAAQFIAEAALVSGKQVQAFPEYGPERTGAPVKSFVRISDKPITTHAPVAKPDIALVIDPTLIGHVDFSSNMDKNGIIIVNSPKSSDKVKEDLNFAGAVHTVDATKISIELVGKNLPNTPILGALIKIKEVVKMDDLIQQVKSKFLHKIGEEKTNANIEAIKKAYNQVK